MAIAPSSLPGTPQRRRRGRPEGLGVDPPTPSAAHHTTSVASRGSLLTPMSHQLSVKDFAKFKRDELPVGVSHTFAVRMQLDSQLSPALLSLRTNHQNIEKEIQVHGHYVTHQLSRMRHKSSSEVALKRGRLGSNGGWRLRPLTTGDLGVNNRGRSLSPDKSKPTLRQTGLIHSFRRLTEADRKQPKLDKLGEMGATLRYESPAITMRATNTVVSSKMPQHAQKLQKLLDGALGEEERRVQAAFEAYAEEGQLKIVKIPRVMEVLGYPKPNLALIRDSMRYYIRDSEDVNLTDFNVILGVFKSHRRATMRKQFASLDTDHSGKLCLREFRAFLWDCGYTVNTDQVEEIFAEVDEDGSMEIDIDEFETALCIVHNRHGFTAAEAEELLSLFDRYDADQSGELNADEIAHALGWFGTPTTSEAAEELINRFDEDESGSLCRPEFLYAMRMRLEDEISHFRTLFADVDSNNAGTLNASQIRDLFVRTGYTLSPEVVEECIEELGVTRHKDGFIFEHVMQILRGVRRCEGFSAREVNELSAIFRQNDSKRAGELREFELTRALNSLGYPINRQKRWDLWFKVDVNMTGLISNQEFLKVVRLLREEEEKESAEMLRTMYQNAQYTVTEHSLKGLVAKLGHTFPRDVIKKALKIRADSTGDGIPDVRGVLKMLAFLRDAQVEALKQSEGIEDRIASKIRVCFKINRHAGQDEESLYGKYITTEDFFTSAKSDMFRAAGASVREARRLESSVAKFATNETLNIKRAFLATSNYLNAREEDRTAREKDIVEKAGFERKDVVQLRRIFVEHDVEDNGDVSPDELRRAFQNVVDEDVLGCQMSASNLERQLARTLGGSKECIDFPEFLRLLGVMRAEFESASR